VTPALFTFIVFPVIYALINLVAGRLVNNRTRKGDQKFRVFLFEGSGEKTKEPLDLYDLRNEFRSKTNILDIEVMPSGIWETNIGTDLCVAAIAANILIIINMLGTASVIYAIWLRIFVGALLVIEIFVFLSILRMVQEWGNDRKPQKRVRTAQLSNLLGVVLLIIQFLIFGKVLTL